MSKKELDDILKFGTEQMFKDEAEGSGTSTRWNRAVSTPCSFSHDRLLVFTSMFYCTAIDELNKIVYDDGAIERLLDRSGGTAPAETVTDEEPVNEVINEYLSSFKVAFYQVKETDDGDDDYDDDDKVRW